MPEVDSLMRTLNLQNKAPNSATPDILNLTPKISMIVSRSLA
jgi:hypothetical protein